MVGQGVLRECLLDPNVEAIVAVGRTTTGALHPMLQEFVRQDLCNCADVAVSHTSEAALIAGELLLKK